MKKNGEVFECYSKKMQGFFTMKGFRYKERFRHKVTGRICWTYIMNNEISQALKEWNENKPTV